MIKKGLELELDIVDLAFGGKGVAKVPISTPNSELPTQNFIIFVDGALPGQKVLGKISVKKRRHAEAKLLKVLERSADELETKFQPTPGAPWLCLPIELQREHKQKQVFELFKKFAGIDLNGHPSQSPLTQGRSNRIFDEYIESPVTEFYRNKMDYSFGPTTETCCEVDLKGPQGRPLQQWQHTGFGLGSKKRGQFWLVENLEQPSGLFDQEFEKLLPKFRQLCESLEPSVYNSRTNQGFWRQLVVKKSFYENAFLLNIITNIVDPHPELDSGSLAEALVNFWTTNLPDKVKGIYWTQSDDSGNANDKYRSRELIYGESKLTEKISLSHPELSKNLLDSDTGDPSCVGMTNELLFDISIDSFFQTNIFSAELLYAKVASYCRSPRHKTGLGDALPNHILELFAGTGTISQILARQNPPAKITSVEIVEAAVTDAKANAQRNGISRINFVCDDVNKFMKSYKSPLSKGNLEGFIVVLDPPRAGIAPKALQRIIDFTPQEIVYISCNPATLARDTATLLEGNYELQKLSLVDQFPHTAHVECVAKFVKKWYNI